jgi:hypothetical protein
MYKCKAEEYESSIREIHKKSAIVALFYILKDFAKKKALKNIIQSHNDDLVAVFDELFGNLKYSNFFCDEIKFGYEDGCFVLIQKTEGNKSISIRFYRDERNIKVPFP